MKQTIRIWITKALKPLFPLLFYKRFQKLLAQIDKCFTEKIDVFLFYPAYHIGGAEKIHLEILKTIHDKKIAVFITNKSSTDALKKDFVAASDHFIDFYKLGNYSFFQKKLINILKKKINSLEYKCTVFVNVKLFQVNTRHRYSKV